MTDNRTTELRISEPLRGFIRHQSNHAYIDGGQSRWLTKIANEIDAKHEQAVDDARIVEVETSYIDIEQGEVITRFVPEQAIAATLGSGALTAEQVRAAIFSGSSYASYDGAEYYADGINMQAIADELNAELGSGTCEMEYGGDITLDTARVMGVYFCSECGSPIYNDCMPYFCGYCGKAVKR